MTTEELRKKFNDEFGPKDGWPLAYEVNAETYGNVCQSVFTWAAADNIDKIFRRGYGDLGIVEIAIGPNNGIMFKNVELILKRG